MDLMAEQLKLEKEAYDYSYNRMIREISKRVDANQADELSEGKLILKVSLDVITAKLQEYFSLSLNGVLKYDREYFIDYYNRPKELAYILIMCIIQTISKDPYVKVTALAKIIGNALYENHLLAVLKKETPNLNSYIDKNYKRHSKKRRATCKAQIARRKKDLIASLTPATTRALTALIDIVVNSGANIIEKKTIVDKNKRNIVICYTNNCFRMVTQSRELLLNSYKKYPILIVPPKDWTDFDGSGGYYTEALYKVKMIKTRSGNNTRLIRDYFKEAPDKVAQLPYVLNILQQTPWKINKRVYDVASTVFRDNIVDYASPKNQPYLVGGLPYNEHLEPEDFLDLSKYGELHTEGYFKGTPKDKEQFKLYMRDKQKQSDIIASIFGKNIGVSLALTDAEKYLTRDRIYFSYNYDFRGRIYPIQQHLHPQGNGIMKALLMFADGVPIENEEQENWWWIHGANCYGYDKLEYADRIKNMKGKKDEILAIAAEPIQNRHLWKDTDEPYLYLAWCFECASYLTNPDDFVSYIPIGLDATCSGIQIYSGLLLDREGAEAVNVIGSTRQDIYQRVADKANSYLASGDYPKQITYTTADKERHTVSTVSVAAEFKGNIKRSLTKRNTMTQPYSVTKFGMYQQLKDELDSMEADGSKFWTADNWLAAKLLVDLNDRAIADTVKGARLGQAFLKEVTADLVKQGKYVFYRTPFIGFPVLQKIHRVQETRVSTNIGTMVIYQDTDEIHQIKMVNGIAPNYIHSLDVTLLILTLLDLYRKYECRSFHFIHDQYGVPINQVPNLNKAVREAYVKLFSSDPLQHWLSQVYKGYPKSASEVIIGDLDLQDVLKSEYIFS